MNICLTVHNALLLNIRTEIGNEQQVRLGQTGQCIRAFVGNGANSRRPGVTEVECVIFDCDGVLIDSELISARIIIEELAREGVSIDLFYVQANFIGRSFTRVAGYVLEHFGIAVSDDFEAGYRQRLSDAFANELRPMPGIFAVLESLTIPSCVATSSSPGRVRNCLDLTGLAAYFGVNVFTSSQVQHGKPAPDLFLFAASEMQAAPAKCLVIEDSETGVEAALRAGMSVWQFCGGSHFAGLTFQAPKSSGQIRVFDNWAVFPDMLAAELNG